MSTDPHWDGVPYNNKTVAALSAQGLHRASQRESTTRSGRARNLRAVQLLLGHTKIESTVRYLGIEVDDAPAIAEQVDV
jgi:hypothetical protein